MDFVDIITKVGFPIACCIALCVYILMINKQYREELKQLRDEQNEEMREMRKEHKNEVNELKKSIDRNSDVVTQLLVQIGGEIK